MMNHKISYRRLTPEESEIFSSKDVSWTTEYIIGPFFTGGVVSILGMILVSIMAGFLRKIGVSDPDHILVPLIVGAFVLGLIAATFHIFKIRKSKRNNKKTKETEKVEIIEIDKAEIIEQKESENEGPKYFIGIGKGKILYLGGQWLWDENSFDIPSFGDSDQFHNTLPFPTDSFSIERIIPSGRAIKIKPKGLKVKPKATLPDQTSLPSWINEMDLISDTAVFTGNIEELYKRTQ